MRILLSLLLIIGILLPAQADVRPASIFTDNLVLQRDQPVPVWGRAAPGETVTVEFAGQKVSTQADGAGKWKVALKPMPANASPQTLTINTTTFTNVLVGDVWLCSGQSNMGLEVRKALNASQDIARANYPLIRGFMVGAITSTNQSYPIIPTVQTQRYALTPQETCEGAWRVCTPANVINWSGVGYFFGRNLHEKLNVPVGLIMASCGATAIESWIGLEGLKAIPAYHERAISFEEIAKEFIARTNSYPASLETEKRRIAERCQKWFAEIDAEEPGLQSLKDWLPVSLPVTPADNPLGEDPKTVWFCKDVTVPAELVGKEIELKLGLVDGADETFVNGTRVGRTWFDTPKYWSVSRVYPVTPATANVSIAVRVVKLKYPMAFFGPASNMTLGASISLTGEWRMAKSKTMEAGRQPLPAALLDKIPGNYYGHPGVQYNGMIHPIVPYAIRGVIWYQGEANAPFYVDYRSLMPGLIQSWRQEWGYDFPFGIVALADYQPQQTKAVERLGGCYHLIREAQAMALSVTNTFLATAVGVGEGADIHPKRKQEVGRRLALAYLGVHGPTYQSMSVEGSKIRLRFDSAKGLHSQGDPPVGFGIAGEDRKYFFAKAKIEGETMVVWSEKVPKPIAVRYAWASNPVCNVYNGDELPLFQFRTDNWDQSQLVIPDDDPIILPTGWVPK